MRSITPGLFLSMALLMPNVGTAQVLLLPTPSPEVNAASADWQIRGDPIFYAGNYYYRTGPSIFFDGNTMVRTGVYQGIPLYADRTLEPYSIVFVPIGRNLMRPYERLREGELAGTVGSRTPSFPIQRDGDLSVRSRPGGLVAPPVRYEPEVLPEALRAVGTTSVLESRLAADSRTRVVKATPSPPVTSYVPRATSNDGVWIEYDGARWYSAGRSVGFDPDRFVPLGNYRGFIVYREKIAAGGDTIFVTVVPDGPVAPYSRR